MPSFYHLWTNEYWDILPWILKNSPCHEPIRMEKFCPMLQVSQAYWIKKMWLSLWKGVNKNMRWIWNTPPAAGPLAGKDIAFVSVGIQWFKSWLIHNICRDVLFQGDGLEFKRQFPKIKAQLKDIIERWSWRGLSQCVEMLGVICVPGQEYNRRTARASERTVSRKWNPTK